VNKLIGEITDIQSLERLNLIKCKVGSQTVNVLMLEMNIDLKPGKKAELLIKPTAVSISGERCSFENSLRGQISEINKGEILSSITVDVEGFEIECIMLSEYDNFEKNVFVMFKANDVAIGKVFE
jgi:molybdopterin-binding protein